jgi:hypothetical protein
VVRYVDQSLEALLREHKLLLGEELSEKGFRQRRLDVHAGPTQRTKIAGGKISCNEKENLKGHFREKRLRIHDYCNWQ